MCPQKRIKGAAHTKNALGHWADSERPVYGAHDKSHSLLTSKSLKAAAMHDRSAMRGLEW